MNFSFTHHPRGSNARHRRARIDADAARINHRECAARGRSRRARGMTRARGTVRDARAVDRWRNYLRARWTARATTEGVGVSEKREVERGRRILSARVGD